MDVEPQDVELVQTIQACLGDDVHLVLILASKKTLVLVFFEEGIPQRDQDCKAGTEFFRSIVLVGEHTKKPFR